MYKLWDKKQQKWVHNSAYKTTWTSIGHIKSMLDQSVYVSYHHNIDDLEVVVFETVEKERKSLCQYL